MNESYSLIYGFVGMIIGIRGIYGLWRFKEGKGADFFYWPWFKPINEERAAQLNWFAKYSWWKSSIMWVGSKDKPTIFERYYLFIGSVLQVVVGCLGLILVWLKLS
jgi:hypothetical protein